jgi:recombination protein RecA
LSNLDSAVKALQKQYGPTSIMRLGSSTKLDVKVIPTGSLAIDTILGVGGVPRGRVIEIYGTESGGKTTLTLHIIAQAQKLGGQCAFIDAEHALDPTYARKLGVNTEDLFISQPDDGEQALEIAEGLIKSNEVDVVVVDSVAALVPRAELEGDMGQPTMGLQARLMSQCLRKLTAVTSKSKTCLIFINQIREKIGVMFGNPETTTGGRALKFYSSIRLDIRRSGQVKDGDVKTGNLTKVRCVKNKVAAPFKETEVEIVYGEGICNERDLITLGVANNLVEKSGAWYTLGGQRFQGEDNLRDALKANPTVSVALESALRKIYFGESK